jgi:hypothetical protein
VLRLPVMMDDDWESAADAEQVRVVVPVPLPLPVSVPSDGDSSSSSSARPADVAEHNRQLWARAYVVAYRWRGTLHR